MGQHSECAVAARHGFPTLLQRRRVVFRAVPQHGAAEWQQQQTLPIRHAWRVGSRRHDGSSGAGIRAADGKGEKARRPPHRDEPTTHGGHALGPALLMNAAAREGRRPETREETLPNGASSTTTQVAQKRAQCHRHWAHSSTMPRAMGRTCLDASIGMCVLGHARAKVCACVHVHACVCDDGACLCVWV